MKYAKRFVVTLLSAVMLTAATPVFATSYYAYAKNWWVNDSDVSFYFLDGATSSTYATGLCGSGVYILKVGQANYDQVFLSLLFAAKNNYKIVVEVTTCSGSYNLIKQVKVCTWLGDC